MLPWAAGEKFSLGLSTAPGVVVGCVSWVMSCVWSQWPAGLRKLAQVQLLEG